MKEATPEKSAGDKAFEAEQAGDDQQEVSYVNGQGWQLKNYYPNPNNKEHDRSKSVNSIDDLAAKVDQLLKRNQSQVFIMEEATPEKSAGDKAFEAEQAGDDQQEVSYVNGKGWQLKNYHPNPNHKGSEQLSADQADERNTEPALETSSPGPEQPAEAVHPIPEAVPPREYIPKVPYPVPARATRKDKEEIKCRKMLEDLTVRLPLMDAIQMMPSMRSFMKGLISGKISEESEFITVSKECSANDGVVYRRGDLLSRNIAVLYIPALPNSKPGFYFITDFVPVPASAKDRDMVLIGG
ncbi:hypothetical protein DY000_02033193 [Brassica cretica]|uniref:Uncharacterized protein n=1 Tax=Brassica cretica TaxID=69181 RepID=A0ABQ7DZP2_BRACR|nr:hypothetical protein DY000_02033193 [Brassica cretica]